ncbi:hypothetical protein [Haloarcula sp. Atlit-7R]|uniref:hypothetical protein n=1 Tax=Haloarcula sp. Atlit-7R TaxID=2282125 RepID=UPI0011C3A16F|nr:hypothetical protein [Haloarcula sp. Atlit-7R]
MQRRKFLVGMGSLAAGSAAAMGTGAVDRVTAGRDVSISVVGDASAEVQLVATSKYASYNNDDALELDLPDLNPDADLEFYDLFTIRNASNQSLGIFVDNAGAAASNDREEPPVNANMYDEVKNALGTAQHGWFDEDRNAGKINQGEAMPSAYRSGSTNDTTKGWNPASDPYILRPGKELTPDWYIFDIPGSGASVSATLDVWAFSQEFAQVAEKGP